LDCYFISFLQSSNLLYRNKLYENFCWNKKIDSRLLFFLIFFCQQIMDPHENKLEHKRQKCAETQEGQAKPIVQHEGAPHAADKNKGNGKDEAHDNGELSVVVVEAVAPASSTAETASSSASSVDGSGESGAQDSYQTQDACATHLFTRNESSDEDPDSNSEVY
jgi:hypothetical protein